MASQMLTTRQIDANDGNPMIQTVKDSTFTNLIDGKQVPMDSTVRIKRTGMKTSKNARSDAAFMSRKKPIVDFNTTGLTKIDPSLIGRDERKGTTRRSQIRSQ
jgi:hypothetical protein